MMIDDDVGGVTGMGLKKCCWTMHEKKLPIELADTTIGDPCSLVDGNFFIWTSTHDIYVLQVHDEY